MDLEIYFNTTKQKTLTLGATFLTSKSGDRSIMAYIDLCIITCEHID